MMLKSLLALKCKTVVHSCIYQVNLARGIHGTEGRISTHPGTKRRNKQRWWTRGGLHTALLRENVPAIASRVTCHAARGVVPHLLHYQAVVAQVSLISERTVEQWFVKVVALPGGTSKRSNEGSRRVDARARAGARAHGAGGLRGRSRVTRTDRRTVDLRYPEIYIDVPKISGYLAWQTRRRSGSTYHRSPGTAVQSSTHAM